MTGDASARMRWAVEALDLSPDERILEVGCGHGVAAELVCELLDGGHLTAIDRSAKMIAAASKRNRAHVEAGRARFEVASIESAELGTAEFDKAFAFHVAALWRLPAAADAVRRHLAPAGRLLVFDKPPRSGDATAAIRAAQPAVQGLRRFGFDVAEPVAGQLPDGSFVTRVVATPGD